MKMGRMIGVVIINTNDIAVTKVTFWTLLPQSARK